MSLAQRIRDRLGPGALERLWFSAAAVVLGVGAGAGVAVFRGLYHAVDHFAYGVAAPWLAGAGTWTSVLVPAAGGVLAGLIVSYVIGPERHHGVAGIVEAVALDGGRLRYRRAPAKAVGAAISIGTGASVGPEDPSVQIGANLGSFLGQRLGFSDERVRMLVAAGAAAGVAAAFGAPMAGVFFALEVILGDLAGTGVGIVLVTSVLAVFTCGGVSGGGRALVVPDYDVRALRDVPVFLLAGAAIGPAAALYVRCIDGARGWFERSGRARWTRPVLAGAAVGVAALWFPQVRGVDQATLESVLRGAAIPIGTLAAIAALKILLTGACIGAGFPGGVFAPALFTGAMVGAAFGAAAQAAFPDAGVQAGACALAGMAAFLAAAVHAPLTAILLVFEITGDYGMVGAAMCAVAVAMVGARWIEPESVYSRALVRKGFRRRALSPYETEVAAVETGSACDGRTLRDVEWPAGCVVARVRRGTATVVPSADLRLVAGDTVVAVVDDAQRDAFRTLCRGPGDAQ